MYQNSCPQCAYDEASGGFMEGSVPCYHGTSLSHDDCIHSPHSHELIMNSVWLDEVRVRVESDVRPTVNLHASSLKWLVK